MGGGSGGSDAEVPAFSTALRNVAERPAYRQAGVRGYARERSPCPLPSPDLRPLRPRADSEPLPDERIDIDEELLGQVVYPLPIVELLFMARLLEALRH